MRKCQFGLFWVILKIVAGPSCERYIESIVFVSPYSKILLVINQGKPRLAVPKRDRRFDHIQVKDDQRWHCAPPSGWDVHWSIQWHQLWKWWHNSSNHSIMAAQGWLEWHQCSPTLIDHNSHSLFGILSATRDLHYPDVADNDYDDSGCLEHSQLSDPRDPVEEQPLDHRQRHRLGSS